MKNYISDMMRDEEGQGEVKQGWQFVKGEGKVVSSQV